MCSQGGATFGGRTSLSKVSTPNFQNCRGQRWTVLTAFVRHEPVLSYDPSVTKYAMPDSKYKDFPDGV